MSQPDLTDADVKPALLTMEQTAVVLGCTPRMVRELQVTKRLPYVKVGSLVRFRRSDIDAYIEENLVDPRKAV